MHIRAATLVLASFVCDSAARAQAPTYDVAFLGAPAGLVSHPHGVNDDGLVIGNFVSASGAIIGASRSAAGADRAVVWTPGPSGYQVAPLPNTAQGATPAWCFDVNEHGDVVGALSNGGGFAWRASTGTQDLATLGVFGVATGVNESRQVACGQQRIDLDTNFVELGNAVATPWGFNMINDAGVCGYSTQLQPGVTGGGTFEFGVGATPYAVGAPGFVAGLDYAGTLIYATALGPPSGNVVHSDDFGEFTIQSRLDPSAAAWTVDLPTGARMSANGRITVYGQNNVTAQAGALLLTPQRFHAILKGAPGAQGLPVLTGEGALTGGSPVTFRLSRAAKSAPVGIIVGLAAANLAFYGGTLVPQPTLVLTGLSTDASGNLKLGTTWPSGLPSGTKLYLQEWIADANAPSGIAGSNALECVVP